MKIKHVYMSKRFVRACIAR